MWVFFFFQAEDGIRYLVRSRGLGDVYKRQKALHQKQRLVSIVIARYRDKLLGATLGLLLDITPVSYTHLTLPTSDLV